MIISTFEFFIFFKQKMWNIKEQAEGVQNNGSGFSLMQLTCVSLLRMQSPGDTVQLCFIVDLGSLVVFGNAWD